MDVKYTFRDLIVYLLTGFISLVLFAIAKPEYVNLVLESDYLDWLKNSTFIFLILSIPILYILGHIIQIFDLIISFYFAQPLSKFKWNDKYRSKLYSPLRLLYFFCAASTAEFQYKKRKIKQVDFNDQKYFLIIENKFNSAEYFYLLKELFNGLRIFMFFLVIYLIFNNQQDCTIILIYTCLYALFWIKAINSGKNYAYEITKVYKAIKKND